MDWRSMDMWVLFAALVAAAAALYFVVRGPGAGRKAGLAGLAAVGTLLLLWFPGLWLFDWCFSRVEVPPGSFLVRIHRWGADLPEGATYSDGAILAPDETYKGVLPGEWGEGRYYLNPFMWSYEIHPMVDVPPGKVLVRTRLYGAPIPPDRLAAGDFLARDGERGVVAEAWGPGKYRINPYAYTWKLEDAVEIKAGEVGVCTLKVGADPTGLSPDDLRPTRETPAELVRLVAADAGASGGPALALLNAGAFAAGGLRTRGPFVVPEGCRGVQEHPLSSGTYYINPYVKRVVPVDTRSHQVEFRDIEFPSRDGFHIKPHVTVTVKVMDDLAPQLYVTLSDKGELPLKYDTQADLDDNPVLQKVVLPLVRGYVRIEGSKMAGRDFVAQSAAAAPGGQEANPREVLQQKLMAKAAPACREMGVALESITVSQSEKDADLEGLAQQIADREQARLEKEKNVSLIEQYKEQQALATTKAMEEQGTAQVDAKTKLKTATIEAQQKLEVEKKKLEQDLKNAQVNLDAAKDQAEAVLAQAAADAEVVMKENEAKVAGLRTAVEGFNSPDQFAQYQMVMHLAPALKEIFASDTSDFAKLFSAYMTQPPARAPTAHAGANPEPAVPVMPPAGPAGK